MNAEIITIGDEILIGQIIDTNSAWIAAELEKIGVTIFQMRSISDDKQHIIETLECAKESSDLVIITGGLGPTSDDITKQTLAEYFESKLVRNTEVEKHIIDIMTKRGIPMLERNLQQADVPENCQVLFNENGTAPGMWFEKDNTIFVSMPGVPFEMKTIMQNGVIPKIKEKFKLSAIYHRTLLTKGFFESVLSEKLIDFESQLNKRVKLAYLPSPETIRLRLTIRGENYNEIKNIVDLEAEKLYKILPDNIFGEDKQTIAEVIGQLLKSKNAKMASAESCTGGNIAHLITEVAGCSEYYKGSVVAYSNDIKRNLLNVSKSDLDKYGAVSKQVVEQMAMGAVRLFTVDYGVATSGIAGPDGGTTDKPVGTIWIAVATKWEVFSKKFIFTNLRDINIRRATNNALEMLRLLILDKDIETF